MRTKFMIKFFILLAALLMPLKAALAETYEQAFVACSEQVAGADGDHKAALDACLRARGFEPETDTGGQ